MNVCKCHSYQWKDYTSGGKALGALWCSSKNWRVKDLQAVYNSGRGCSGICKKRRKILSWQQDRNTRECLLLLKKAQIWPARAGDQDHAKLLCRLWYNRNILFLKKSWTWSQWDSSWFCYSYREAPMDNGNKHVIEYSLKLILTGIYIFRDRGICKTSTVWSQEGQKGCKLFLILRQHIWHAMDSSRAEKTPLKINKTNITKEWSQKDFVLFVLFYNL